MSSKTKERIVTTQLTKEEVEKFDSGILRYLERHSKKKVETTPTQPAIGSQTQTAMELAKQSKSSLAALNKKAGEIPLSL